MRPNGTRPDARPGDQMQADQMGLQSGPDKMAPFGPGLTHHVLSTLSCCSHNITLAYSLAPKSHSTGRATSSKLPAPAP